MEVERVGLMEKKLADITWRDGIAIVAIDSPPVNALSNRVRSELGRALQHACATPGVRGIILLCKGRTFFAGADIKEIGKAKDWPDLIELGDLIEQAPAPVVAAMHGSAFGGGLELALACHYRVAVPSAKVGLPEVNLGLIPGGGGTQRLPRIIGAAKALDVIAFGRPLPASQAHVLGLIDSLVDEQDLAWGAVQFLQSKLDTQHAVIPVRDRSDALAEARHDPGLFERFRAENKRVLRGLDAPEAAICAIEAAVNMPFEAGLAFEHEQFVALAASSQSAARRYAFFAERNSVKVPDIPAGTPALTIDSVAVIGGGLMGTGIATCFLAAGIAVTLIEQSSEALERGVAAVDRNLASAVKRGQLTSSKQAAARTRLEPTINIGAVAEADLVIEAVFEHMDAKQALFRSIAGIVKPTALIASNTSFLDIDKLAASISRPERFLGLHFFSPANVMPLLEIVRGAFTSSSAIVTALKIAQKIGKTPVLAGNCPGFIANRAMAARSQLVGTSLLDGFTPQEIDEASVAFGFPMGPFQMTDLVGLEVAASTPTGEDSMGILRTLIASGRIGQKAGRGYYDYGNDRVPVPSPEVAALLAKLSTGRKPDWTAATIAEYQLFPVVNEATRILEEGFAVRASDIDVAIMLGYGWPAATGGPMFWADSIGLDRVVSGLRVLAERYGVTYAPCALLERLAQGGGRLHEVQSARFADVNVAGR